MVAAAINSVPVKDIVCPLSWIVVAKQGLTRTILNSSKADTEGEQAFGVQVSTLVNLNVYVFVPSLLLVSDTENLLLV